MAGPSTDTKAIIAAHLMHAYVAANGDRLKFNKDDVLNIYNEFVGMVEDQYAPAPGSGYDLTKLIE
jgi:hypothetical protein